MPTAKPRSQSKGKATSSRPVVYDSVTCTVRAGATAITVQEAKELLGWQEESEAQPFGTKFLLKLSGKKIRCTNNESNRRLVLGVVEMLKQEHLRGRWRLNGEPLIIGRTGLVLNGQHTLISLIAAAEEWHDNASQWSDCKQEPVLEKVLITGISEDAETVNTMDTCRPRSLSDVIFRSHYFQHLSGQAQRQLSDMTKYAINKLWEKSGQHSHAHVVRRTHSESIAFLEQHPRILNAVKHIYEEDNNENKISKYLTRGYAAAALYLMGSSATDPGKYYVAEHPNETMLDWSHWDKACNFFVELASGSKKLQAVHKAIMTLVEQGAGSIIERWSILARAWHHYLDDQAITDKHLQLEFEVKDGERFLVEVPLIGGIDVGEDGYCPDPTPEEIEQVTTKLRTKRNGADKPAKPLKPYRKHKDEWSVDDVAWVLEQLDKPELGTVSCEPYLCADEIWRVEVTTRDGVWEVPLTALSMTSA